MVDVFKQTCSVKDMNVGNPKMSGKMKMKKKTQTTPRRKGSAASQERNQTRRRTRAGKEQKQEQEQEQEHQQQKEKEKVEGKGYKKPDKVEEWGGEGNKKREKVDDNGDGDGIADKDEDEDADTGTDGDEDEKNNNGEKEEEEEEVGELLLTEYEKQRENRIKENASKLSSLNLPTLLPPASSSASIQKAGSLKEKGKKKSNSNKDDDDYMPSNSGSEHESEEDNADEDEDDGDQMQKKAHENIDEALALSLADVSNDGNPTSTKVAKARKRNHSTANNQKSKTIKKGRRTNFSCEDIAAIFSIFDERGKGNISLADLERVATSHDFTWSKEEFQDMINIFDSNKDGYLELTEFQGIFKRGGILKQN